jgi:ABC-type branched-subunit amino acid transport system ATPase component/ABC-type branched-subunit amino acid transport system permease subunit
VSRLRHPIVFAALGLVVLPHVVQMLGLATSLATEIAIFAMVGLGYNLLLGYTGLLSFGHGVFFGLAAYAFALFQIHWFPGQVAAPFALALAFAALLGLVIGFLVLRRRGVYFSLLTLAFTALVFYVVFRWTSFTGGENGLRGIQRPPALENQLVFYHAVAAVVLATAYAMWRLVHSPLGTVLVAIRENERRTQFLGYPVRTYKLIAFVLSAAVTGLGGILFALLKVFVSADLVHVAFSGELVAMTVIGGMGHFLGPALGSLFFILFRELLSGVTGAWLFWFGLLFMGFILFSPSGLIGLGERLLRPFRRPVELAAAMTARATPAPDEAIPAFLGHEPLPPGTVMLACRGVSKSFGGLAAVRDAELELRFGRVQALIGPNGAGKTTLFNAISGLFQADRGAITLFDRRIEREPPHRIALAGLARSFQIASLFPALTVHEALRLGCQGRDARRFATWRNARALPVVAAETAELIRFLGLRGLEDVPVSALSHGGQRLVEIGLTLAVRPRVLLLDEPLVGLAAAERERIVGMIRRLSAHMGVLMVEHDIDRVFEAAGAITVMNEGAVIVDGPPAAVRADPRVQEIYLGKGRPHAVRAAPAGAADATPVLRLEAINTFYGKSHVLHDVTLEVRPGEVVALLGRNGAGKSSTLKSIMGLVPPRTGRVEFLGRDVTGLAPEQVARLGIGLVPQARRLFPNLTVAENLRLGRLRRGAGAWTPERIAGLFPRVAERMGQKADTLSGGEQQMVAIARALAGDLRLLLLDEPFEGLSPAIIGEIFAALDKLSREVPILLIEHDLDLALALSDRVYVLDRGRLTYEGPAAPLANDLARRKDVLWI